MFIIGRHCAAMRSKKSFAVFSLEPGRGLMKTIFLFGGVRLTLILSQPRGMMSKVAMYKSVDLHKDFIEVGSCLEDVES